MSGSEHPRDSACPQGKDKCVAQGGATVAKRRSHASGRWLVTKQQGGCAVGCISNPKQLPSASLSHTRRVPFQRNLTLFPCAVQQIQIDEILIGNVCFERKLLEIPDHIRLQSDRHRFLESLDIGVRRCGREVIFFSHGFSPSRVVVLWFRHVLPK